MFLLQVAFLRNLTQRQCNLHQVNFVFAIRNSRCPECYLNATTILLFWRENGKNGALTICFAIRTPVFDL